MTTYPALVRHFFLVLAFHISPLVAEPRTFTARDGRTVEATLVGKSETTATIRSSVDGKEYTLPLDHFSEADLTFVEAWVSPLTPNSPTATSIKDALDQAKKFVKSGEPARALQQFEWIAANAPTTDPSERIQVMTAINEWANLGSTHPPALESLRKLRAGKAASLLAGEAGRDTFLELAGIDRSLATVDSLSGGSTARFFKKLDAEQPELAKECFIPAMSDLWHTSEVEIFAKHATDLRELLLHKISDYEAQYQVLKPRGGEELIAETAGQLRDFTRFLGEVAKAQNNAALSEELKAMTDKVLGPDV